MKRLRLLFDNFSLAVAAVVLVASLLPAQGTAAQVFEGLTYAGIALLFFLHGARLSRRAIIDGAMHWRLHAVVFASTFLMFPLIGLGLSPVLEPVLGNELRGGVLFLCALPGTVQSAIAFTSIARGNVPAAVCAASASSLVGIIVTPLLVALMLGVSAQHAGTGETILKISTQLLLPFCIGHALRPWIGAWVHRKQRWLRLVDQGSILLVVYTAFGAAVLSGLWRSVPLSALLLLSIVCVLLLILALVACTWVARRLSFGIEDEITIVFCGSKKSMATGIPMAQILFSSAAAGAMILPLMLFHQIQLMVSAALAARYAQREEVRPAAGV